MPLVPVRRIYMAKLYHNRKAITLDSSYTLTTHCIHSLAIRIHLVNMHALIEA
jgi:hypothetical protein